MQDLEMKPFPAASHQPQQLNYPKEIYAVGIGTGTHLIQAKRRKQRDSKHECGLFKAFLNLRLLASPPTGTADLPCLLGRRRKIGGCVQHMWISTPNIRGVIIW